MGYTNPPDGSEPALQLLHLPRHDAEPLRAYASDASFLSPLHCRLCLQDVRGPAEALEVPPLQTLDQPTMDGSATDECDPAMVQHLQDAHSCTPLQYRKEVFERSLAQGLQPVPPQVLRTRLAAWKEHFSNENFAMGVCASCATFKRKKKLEEIVFCSPESVQSPAWLGWSVEQWLRYRDAWYCPGEHTHVDVSTSTSKSRCRRRRQTPTSTSTSTKNRKIEKTKKKIKNGYEKHP